MPPPAEKIFGPFLAISQPQIKSRGNIATRPFNLNPLSGIFPLRLPFPFVILSGLASKLPYLPFKLLELLVAHFFNIV